MQIDKILRKKLVYLAQSVGSVIIYRVIPLDGSPSLGIQNRILNLSLHFVKRSLLLIMGGKQILAS